MKTIAFISGKGGTGKTSLVASFAQLAAPVVVADCDVDAANAALLLPGEVVRAEPFVQGSRAVIDHDYCAGCGICLDLCRFGAIRLTDGWAEIDPLACEGCGVCKLRCEFGAVRMEPNEAGEVTERECAIGRLVAGELRPGQGSSGKLVSWVRKLAGDAGERVELILLDGPPGIGCPVHATLAQADLAVIVSEPSLSGEHDLRRALDLLDRFSIPGRVIINKADLSGALSDRIEREASRRGATVVARLPFHARASGELARGRTLLDEGQLRPLLEQSWNKIVSALAHTEVPLAKGA